MPRGDEQLSTEMAVTSLNTDTVLRVTIIWVIRFMLLCSRAACSEITDSPAYLLLRDLALRTWTGTTGIFNICYWLCQVVGFKKFDNVLSKKRKRGI